ncbi:MAG: motility associated factor glycosyltransferase family protein [Candidatus Gastranaerophilaceae bacterium]
MYNKNLKSLEKVNKKLAHKVKNTSLEEAAKHVGAIKSEKSEYLLICDNNYVDDTPSPLEAAKSIYEEQIKSAQTMHDFIVIFGLGIGNLLDYVFNKSISNLIIYEPNLNILRFVMEYVDLSKYFDSKRCFITDNISDCANYIEEKYLLEDKLEFVYLKNYVTKHPSEFTLLTEKIYEACHRKIIDMNTIKVHAKTWVENTFHNIKHLPQQYPLSILENICKGKTALILGAGPSLKDNIESIKKNRNKFVIFTVHRTLETLRQYDIVPDFCIVVDTMWTADSFTKDMEYVKKIKFITDIKSDNFINTLPIETRFTYFSKTNTYAKELSTKMMGDLPLYETGGTSTICAYHCAFVMGFKNIIFAGIDLAFKDDVAYCDGKIAVANNQHSAKISGIVRETTKIKSVTGEYVDTREDYATFAKQFEILFAKDTKSNIFNLTTFGAYIKGMKYISLENILEQNNLSEENIDNIIQEKIQNSQKLQLKIQQKNQEILLNEKNKIIPILKEIDEWYEMYINHPSYFDYATKIITKITSSMILQEYIQIELLRFTKLVLSKDDGIKKAFLEELFMHIRNYAKILYNLI